MSIANIVIEKDRALIGVDTLAGYMQEGRHLLNEVHYRARHAGKLTLFPQFDSAMTNRGDGLLTSIVRVGLETECPYDFDDAVEMMPGILSTAYTQATTHRKQLGIEAFPGAEVVLVGWSPRNSRYLAVRWCRYPEYEDFTEKFFDDRLLLPDIDNLQQVETPDTDAKMEALVRDQVAWAASEHPNLTCGGRLVMAELTRGAVTVRTIADLEAE
ncbi:MAG TPA: hypothetical protein DIS96_03745 [Pusillimonas sp.]|nr:hypothetical protein [Pusillimonas sp.]|tara:strand:- start:232 stop:873 length:642 start_codon:yes stop_codon:yes gene_type:complete